MIQIEAIDKKLAELDMSLKDNEANRSGLEAEKKKLKGEISKLEQVIGSLESQWNLQCQEERELKRLKADMDLRSEKLGLESKIQEKYAEDVPDFYEAVKQPLEQYISNNARNWIGMKKTNAFDTIARMKKAVRDHMDKNNYSANSLGVVVIDHKNTYETFNKKIIRLELQKPDNYELEVSNAKFILQNNWAELFRNRIFKQLGLNI